MSEKALPDVVVRNEGSIWVFEPRTDAGSEWITENVDPSAQWFAGSLVCEHRYGPDLAEGMMGDGLTLVGA